MGMKRLSSLKFHLLFDKLFLQNDHKNDHLTLFLKLIFRLASVIMKYLVVYTKRHNMYCVIR